jgi:hypothetical protein
VRNGIGGGINGGSGRHACCFSGAPQVTKGGSVATTPRDDAARLLLIAQEERELAARTGRGDRAAFDQLFDRYFDRVAWQLRHLPEPEAKAAIWETLEQIFAGIESSDETWLAARAYRIACSSRAAAETRMLAQPQPELPRDGGATPRTVRR